MFFHSGARSGKIYHATKDVKFGNEKIDKNDFFALRNNKILAVRDTLESIALHTVEMTLKKEEYAVVTLFYGKFISAEYMERLVDKLSSFGYDAEIATVSTLETNYDITITFE